MQSLGVFDYGKVEPIVDELLLANATVNSPGESEIIEIAGAKHVDVLIVIGGAVGAPNITFSLDVVEELTGAVIRSYQSNQLAGAGTDYITVEGLTLGTTVKLSWSGTLDGANYFTGVTVRLIAKR